MFFSLIKWVIVSLTLIFLIHHLYMYLTNILTVPKIKDLVNKPHQQYNDIFETLNKSEHNKKNTESMAINTSKMTEELSSFLNDLKKTNGSKNRADSVDVMPAVSAASTTTNISDLGYSSY